MSSLVSKHKKWYSLAMTAIMLTTIILPNGWLPAAKAAAANHVVISGIFGGNGATNLYGSDYVELYNPTDGNVALDGWSIQYASATGAFTQQNAIPSGQSIKAHGYYLIKLVTTAGGPNLPVTEDMTGTINLSGTAGKVALAKVTTGITGVTDPNAVDVVGYGTTATGYEGSGPTAAPSSTTALMRKTNLGNDPVLTSGEGNGWDNDDNKTDFVVTATPKIRNSSSPVEPALSGGGTETPPPSEKSANPTASLITLRDDYTTLTGAAGAVTGGSTVNVYFQDNSLAGSTTALSDGSFALTFGNPGQNASVQVSATEKGKDASDKVNVSVQKSAKPDASKITFVNASTVTGVAGAVPNNAVVNVYFADNSLAGTTTAAANGSFSATLSNSGNKTTVNVAAKENGKLESDKASVSLTVSGGAFQPGDVVISQIYANGGNSGAFYKNKLFELYNNTDRDINFNNQWALIYVSATGTSFGAGTKLTGTIKAHGYYLVGGASGTTGADLPITPDQTTTLNPSGSAGGILALANSTTGLSSQDDPNAIDIVAYGNGTNTSFATKTDHWGTPYYSSMIGGGTLLRKTDVGSEPRAAFGLGNGFFSKDVSKDFVINAPNSTANPEEVKFRNTKSMLSPDASKIGLTNTAVTGAAGSVPASTTVKVYVENGGNVTVAGQTTSGADGSFNTTITNPNQSVYVTYTDASQKESVYSRVDKTPNAGAVVPIGQLRTNDANGLLLNIGYATTVEGVVTSGNKALGTEKTSFYIQDATGGISVIGAKDPTFAIQPGHKVRVAGTVAFTASTAQFVAVSVTDLGTATPLTAAAVTLDSLNAYAKAEPLEGKLVTFTGKVANVPTSGPEYNITVADEAGNSANVRIVPTSGIDVAGGAVTLGETYTFTGIVGQYKLTSPYTSGYYVLPRNASDIRGELQLDHTPLLKAYTGVDASFKASAKFADTVTIWYKGQGGSSYTAVPMASADGLNYNGKILKGSMPTGKLLYYIEAVGGGKTKSVGTAAAPIAIDIVQDKDGPEYSNPLPLVGDQLETKHPVISVSMDDPNGVDAATATISIDNVNFTSKAVVTESGIKLTLTTSDDLTEGEHTVKVTSKDKLGNPSTYSWTFKVLPRFTGGNHYRGTTHNHTNISHDAAGAPEDALKAALAHDYDWFAFSDHSHDIDAKLVGTDTVDHKGMPERKGGSDWQLTKDLANQYTKNGSFVVFPAFEMTSTTWGHSNVFGTTNFIDRVQNGGQYQKLQNYYAWVLTYDDVVAQFNHPAMSANAFDNFIPYDKNVDRLFTMLEVGNGSGNYSYANAQDKFFNALDLGWHVSPTYGEDNHDATWGQTKQRTVIVAKDLTQESLLDAMKKMHVYFTEDPNAKLDVTASGWYMGSTVDTKDLQFNITGSDPVLEQKSNPKYSFLKTTSNDNIAKVELVTNGGRVIDTYTPTSDSTSFNWKPNVNVAGGQQWFVVRVTQKDGDRVYSSPIWSPVEPVSVKVSDVSATDGAIVGGFSANLQAGISNLGTVDVTNVTAHFYYDQVDASHFIGDAAIASLKSNASATASVTWAAPVAGEHKIVVVLSSSDNDLGDNKYEQAFSIKAPLGKTVLIDASKQNENSTKDAGTYKDNMKLFTVMMRQQGYTVAENALPITDAVLSNATVLYISHPSTAYGASEIAAINKFVANGGSLLLTEKSNFGGSNQNLNSILSGVGSTLMVNDDGVFDETAYGNFWATPLTSNFSVRAHPTPVSNNLTDFVSTIEYYSGSSLAKNDGSGGKVALTNSDTVTVLVRGNETTFQDSPTIKAGSAQYNVQTSKGKTGPALTDVTGGSAIPLIASETVGKGRVVVSGMNIFNDKQMDQTFSPKGNDPFALNVVNWLSHLEPKVTNIADARKLPDGTQVLIQGKVTTAAGVFFDSAYVQDATGGIMAFNEVPVGSLKLGDEVRVYGHIKIFENNTEIEFDKFDNSIVKVSSGTPVEPKAVSTKQSVSDEYQGQLVKVTGKVTSIPDDTSYIVNDGSGDVLVFVDGYIINQSGPIPKLKVGDTLEAVGLSGKFSGGDRLRVRDTKELKKVGASDVAVTSVKLDQSTLSLKAGGTPVKLNATVNPSNATNTAVTWKSSNTAVATVDNTGKVTPIAAGSATITVTTVDGGFTASSTVTVSATLQSTKVVLSGSGQVVSGTPFDVTYGLKNVDGTIYAQDLVVQYDPTKVTFVSATPVKDGLVIADQTESNGEVRFVVASLGENKGVNADGDLLKLQFTAKALTESADATITVSKAVVAIGNGTETKLDSTSLTFKVFVAAHKDVLNALITDAQNRYDAAVVGTKYGQYSAESKAALKTAIDSAKAVASNDNATQQQVDQAIAALTTAVQTFSDSVVPRMKEDLNGDGIISIGDLAIVAMHYGKTSADPNWNFIKIADINNDGIIDIVDLSMVARKITQGI
ncbi:DUF4350 domain-containing protein [Cohnella endophytica]|nr:DUF4350 domain-containing protein [Cohnella endophytica]